MMPKVQMPATKGRQAAYFFDLFERNADRPMLIEARSGEEITYGRLLHESQVMASFLLERGVKPGEPVAFSMENCQELAALYFACLHLGARVAPITPHYSS